jgi:hypothetical protein
MFVEAAHFLNGVELFVYYLANHQSTLFSLACLPPMLTDLLAPICWP